MSVNTLGYFLKVTRALGQKESFKMSGAAYKLYIALNELEAQKRKKLIYDNGAGMHCFLCTDAEIRELTGMNEKTIQKAKKELKEHELIYVTRGQWHYTATGKADIKQPCKYYIPHIEGPNNQ